MRTSNVAITGANGYVGGHTARFLRGKGYSICHMGRHSGAYEDRFAPFVLGGQNDYAVLDTVDTLIHCAYDFAPRRWEDIERINVAGTAALLQEAKRRGVRKMVFISSISAFENARSYYGQAKLKAEQEARAVGAIIIRPGTVFDREAGSIIGSMDRFVRRFPIVPLIGQGNQIFYPCHSDDLNTLLWILLQQPAGPAEPVTAACAQTITFRELMLLLAERRRKKIRLLPIPYSLLYAGLEVADRLHIKVGLRGGDSLVNLRYPNPHPDFSAAAALSITFRPLTLETLAA